MSKAHLILHVKTKKFPRLTGAQVKVRTWLCLWHHFQWHTDIIFFVLLICRPYLNFIILTLKFKDARDLIDTGRLKTKRTISIKRPSLLPSLPKGGPMALKSVMKSSSSSNGCAIANIVRATPTATTIANEANPIATTELVRSPTSPKLTAEQVQYMIYQNSAIIVTQQNYGAKCILIPQTFVFKQIVEKERKRIARKKERRATLILGLIMGSFIACWFPFFFLYSIGPVCPICEDQPDSPCCIHAWGFRYLKYYVITMNSMNKGCVK